MRSRIFFAIQHVAIVGLFLVVATSIHAQIEDTVSITATVADENIVVFSGDACPLCQVFLLMDGSVVDSSMSQSDGSFQLDIQDIEPITHQFGVYAVDSDRIRSGTTLFNVDVSQGAIIYVSDILVSPTLKVNESEVEKGDEAVFSGYTVPNSAVTVDINGGGLAVQVSSSLNGYFYYNLDTSNFSLATHTARSRVETTTDISGYSETVSFEIVERQEDDDEEDDDEEDETEIATQDIIKETTEFVDEVNQKPRIGKAVDFAVIVMNKGSKVSSGEYLEMKIVIIGVDDQLRDREGTLNIDITDASGTKLYHESYDLLLKEGQKLEKKVRIHCPQKEGDYVIIAEIVIDGQRISEGASAFVLKGNDCRLMKAGLETSLFAQNIGFVSLCEYVDGFIILIIILSIVILWLLAKKKREEDVQEAEKAVRQGFMILHRDIQARLEVISKARSAGTLTSEEESLEKKLIKSLNRVERNIGKKAVNAEKLKK